MPVLRAIDIIEGAYSLIGIWDHTSPLTPFETQLGLSCLNDLIESWNLEELTIYTNLIYEFPFLANCYTYQLGLPEGQYTFNAIGTSLTITGGTSNNPPSVGLTIISQGIPANTTIISGSGNSWKLSQPVLTPITGGDCGFCAQSVSPTGLLGYNWAVPRPTRVERVSIKYYNNSSQPYEIPLSTIDLEHWQAIPVKNVPSTYPLTVYNDEAYPYMNLNFWPVPNGPANCVIYAWDPLSEPTSLLSQVTMPPGYNLALKYSLAIELAINFEREPGAMLVKRAMESKHNLANINQATPEMHYDPMFTGKMSDAAQIALASRGGIVL